MSRRPPNPDAERAAKNQATIKSLLKLEPNKICADCKKNKHPRWASWNLGVFVCIRCSGIHRGMGTHISRVKSVDLDSWTDEQLQSILSWGNARANKYWESKLATGHVPSDAKIENFIRTKYELKRWVMDGGIPDPATLDADGDDDVPLSIVKEKQNIERKESIRKASLGQSSAPRRVAAPQADLIGGGDDLPPRASTAGPRAEQQLPPRAAPVAPKQTVAKDSLFGLDFLSDAPAAPPRPASTTGTAGSAAGQSRPDLKQSILSLYASAPRPQSQQQPSHASTGSYGGFGGAPSPPTQSPTFGHQQQPSSGAGLNNAFAGLSFGNSTSPPPKAPPTDPFASLATASSTRSPPAAQSGSAFSSLSGGGFFDTKPAKPAQAPQQQHQKQPSATSGSLSGWGSPISPVASTAKPAQPSSSSMGDLFDFSSLPPAAAPKPHSPPTMSPPKSAAPSGMDSVFNLSQPKPSPPPAAAAPAATTTGTANPTTTSNGASGWGSSSSDVWANAWSEPQVAKQTTPATKTTTAAPAANDFGWGSSAGGSLANQSIVPGQSGGFGTGPSLASQSIVPGQSTAFNPLAPPKVAADEEFGGWTSSTGGGTSNTRGSAKPASGFGNDDLFNNVWE